ncbi:MAG TPA: alpha/beta fold hydrolase [Burkholderiales bacterium]
MAYREHGGYEERTLATRRGELAVRLYRAREAALGAVWIGGAGGGWDTPARNLYPRLCAKLRTEGITSLRVRLRDPENLPGSVADVTTGIELLESLGAQALALVGHSFGGAVVIQAAVRNAAVRTVVTLATQSYGADPVAALAPRCSILLVHGDADPVVPWEASERVYRLAREPKRFVRIRGAGHTLDEAAGQVQALVRDWILAALRSARVVGAGARAPRAVGAPRRTRHRGRPGARKPRTR